jgi:O-antigen/teichoic acid export membrane protein
MNTSGKLLRDFVYSIIIFLTPRLANVLLFIFIGRKAGPAIAGIFALSNTFLIIFTTLLRGLDDLVTREVARQPRQTPNFLANFVLLRFGMALLLYGLLFGLVRYVFQYERSTSIPLLVFTLCLIPDSVFFVVQSVFLGRQEFRIPALTTVLVTLVKVFGGSLLIFNSGNLVEISWVWVGGSLAGAIFVLGFAVSSVDLAHWREWFDWSPLRLSLRTAWPFFVVTILTTFESQTDTVLLSLFFSETEVGWYNAATTITYSLAMISQGFRLAIYPMMASYAQQAPERLRRLYEQSLHYLGLVVLPMAVGIFLLAPQIVNLLFTDQFTPTIQVIQILLPVLIFMFLNVPSTRWMFVMDQQGWVSGFLFASATINVGLNFLLAPRLGVNGAAIARLCSTGLYFGLAYWFVRRFMVHTHLLRLLAKSLLAVTTMAAVVWLLRNQVLLLPILAGALVYSLVLLLSGDLSLKELGRLIDSFSQRKPAAVDE